MRSRYLIAAVSVACATAQPASPGRAALACGAGLAFASRTTPRGVEAWCEDERGVRTGAFERRFPHGLLAERGSYAAGVLDGDHASFYAHGGPHARGRYVRGRRDGAWRAWHENGKPWLEVRYVAGEPDGAWLEWDYAGAKMFEGTYRNGRLEGAWRTARKDGTPRTTGRSVAGKLDGVITDHGADGSRLEQHYRNNRRHGTTTYYDKDGKAVESEEYVDGVARGGDAR